MRRGALKGGVLRGRRTSPAHFSALTASLLFSVALALLPAPSAWSQFEDEEGTPPDSTLAADSLAAAADSLGEMSLETPEEGPAGPGFHPRYRLSFQDNRDSRTWQQNLQQLSFSLGDRLEVSTGISTNSKKSKNVEQETVSRRSNSEISYALTPSVSIVAHLSLNSNANRTHVGTRSISSDNFDIGTAFHTGWGEQLRADFEISGGSAGNRNPHYDTRGTQGQIKSTFIHRPWPWLNTTVNHQASMARQRSFSRAAGNETRDRERENTLTGTVAISLPHQSSFRVNWTVDSGRFQHPDTIRVGQETKTLSNRSLGLTADLRPLGGLHLTVDGDWAQRVTDYELQREAYVLSRDRGGKVAAKYELPTATKLGISFSTRETRAEYRPEPERPDRSGNTTFHALNGSVSQPLGQRASLDFSGKVDLQVYEFDNRVSYDQDRDVLDQKYSLRASYNPFSAMGLTCDFYMMDRRTIYVLATRSAQNNRARTFSLRPTLTFHLGRGVTISQNYGLDATYTEYTFDDDKNSVARIFSLTTSFAYSLTPHIKLSLGHDYRDTDQGKYYEASPGDRRFSRQTQNEKQEMKVSLDYAPLSLLSLSVAQRLQLDRRWSFTHGRRTMSGDSYNQYFTGQVSGRLAGRQHFSFSYQFALNLGDGERVPDTQRRFWTASVELSYTY